MNAEEATLKTNMLLVLRGPDGRERDRREVHNTTKTAGKEALADHILLDANRTPGKQTHMAIGTATPAATLLGAEIDRNAVTSKTRSGAIVTIIGDWAAGDGTGTITEAGLFEQAGCPSVICGPGNIAQAHAADEYVSIAQLEACMAFLAGLADQLSA